MKIEYYCEACKDTREFDDTDEGYDPIYGPNSQCPRCRKGWVRRNFATLKTEGKPWVEVK